MMKMLRILFIIGIFLYCKLLNVIQAELTVVMTDIDVKANSIYVAQDYEVFLLDEGVDNQIFMNFTVIKFPPDDTRSHLKILGATMGEYIVSTGFEYESLMCEMPNEPIMFGRLARNLGFDGCPGRVGVYGNEAYMIDLDTLPDEFRPNKYLMHVWLETDDEFIGSFILYFTIQ